MNLIETYAAGLLDVYGEALRMVSFRSPPAASDRGRDTASSQPCPESARVPGVSASASADRIYGRLR